MIQLIPLIGITTSINSIQYEVGNQSVVMLPANYPNAVHKAGGIALLLVEGDEPEEVLDILDGIIFSGGRDIDPILYGQEGVDQTKDVRGTQDEWEINLMRGAIERDLPILCTCRGHQLLCIERGGELHQHLPETKGFENHGATGGKWSNHQVYLEKGSILEGLLGAEILVNSGHHQGVFSAGDLSVVGRTDDGLIEAVELDGMTFLISTQWHPEMTSQDEIFTALITAAGN
jgi:putative glutamine amidotransferase